MATTFDLVQEDFAEIKLSETDVFKVRLLKRKDKASFLDLQKKVSDGDESVKEIDIVDVITPYIEEEKQKRFTEIAGDMTFAQIRALQNAFFEMNGLQVPQQ